LTGLDILRNVNSTSRSGIFLQNDIETKNKINHIKGTWLKVLEQS